VDCFPVLRGYGYAFLVEGPSSPDGPFAETRELVGGFAIFNLESREEAVKMATDFMQIHADILGPTYEGELEVRPMFDSAPHAARA
jgi:hypothetical protein